MVANGLSFVPGAASSPVGATYNSAPTPGRAAIVRISTKASRRIRVIACTLLLEMILPNHRFASFPPLSWQNDFRAK
jgi:hypothetical protein